MGMAALRRKQSQLRHRKSAAFAPGIFRPSGFSERHWENESKEKRSGPLTRFEAMGGKAEREGQATGGGNGVCVCVAEAAGRAEQGASSELRRLLREPRPGLGNPPLIVISPFFTKAMTPEALP
jgi:hypothetical protein